MRASFACLALLTTTLTGCAGLSFADVLPGDSSTYLEYGDIAVDEMTERSFVLGTSAATAEDTSPRKILHGVDPDTGDVRTVADVTGSDDTRILFPAPGLLLMTEHGGRDTLELLDRETFAPIAVRDADVGYSGARLSGSRRWLAAADNTADYAPLHLIDAASPSLETRAVPHDGDWLEAAWLHNEDRLFAIVFHGMIDHYESRATNVEARILSWSIPAIEAAGFETNGGGPWIGADRDLIVPDITGDLLFSFAWIGVSPDDRWVVFPVYRVGDAPGHELLVLNTESGQLRTVPDARGPIGFTPDSSTLVSIADAGLGPDGQIDQRLLLIDIETLEVNPQDVPIGGEIEFFVSHEGNFVVVASSAGGQEIVLLDVDHGEQTQMAGPGVGLWEFVSRSAAGELWLVDNQTLFRLDLAGGTLEAVETGFAPEHIEILPQRDRLVMDDALSRNLFFFDPERREIALTAPLPGPEQRP